MTSILLNNPVVRNPQSEAQLAEQLEAMSKRSLQASKIAKLIMTKSPQLVCDTTTLVSGVCRIAGGGITGLVVGGVQAGCAIWELNKALKDAGGVEIKELIEDAQASIGHVRHLNVENMQSYQKIDGQLKQVKDIIKDFETRYQSIKSMAEGGNKKARNLQKQALKHHEEAIRSYKEIEVKLEESQAKNKILEARLLEAQASANHLLNLVQPGLSPEKYAEIVKCAVDQVNYLREAMNAHHAALDKSDEVRKLMEERETLRTQAYSAQQKAVEYFDKRYQEIAELAAGSKVAEEIELIDDIEKEFVIVKQRVKEQEEILEEVQADLEELQQAVESRYTLGNMVAAGVGAYTGGMAAGPTGAVAGGAAGVYLSNRIYDALFQNAPPKLEAPTRKHPVVFGFDEKSSGIWGRFFARRPSRTVGVIKVHLGDEVFVMRFNLGTSKIIHSKDIMTLSTKIAEKVNSGKLPFKQAAAILTQLQGSVIDRGEGQKVKGFVDIAKSPYFGSVRRTLALGKANA